MFCNQCGKPYDNQLSACPFCSAPNVQLHQTVFADEPPAPASPQEVLPQQPYTPPVNHYPPQTPYNMPPEDNNRRSRTALIGVLCILAAVLIAGGAVVMAILHPWHPDTDTPAVTVPATTVNTTVSGSNKVIMPDLRGYSKEDAINRLAELGIAVKEYKEVETTEAAAGFVFNHIPAKDQEVNSGEEAILYIAKKPAAQPTEAPTTTPATVPTKPQVSVSKNTLYVIASDYVTLRAEPTRTGRELAKIDRGEAVTYLSGSGEFYYVSYNGTRGYILAEFLDTDPTRINDKTGNAGLKTGDYLYCCASENATLRESTSMSSKALATINSRERVEYHGKTGEWFYVKYNGKWGYVLQDFFSAQEDAALVYDDE